MEQNYCLVVVDKWDASVSVEASQYIDESYTLIRILMIATGQTREGSKRRSKEEMFIQKRALGRGTFGKVEKCLSKATGQTYAVKMIENVNQLSVESMQSEIEAMKRAKSDYSVELVDNFYDQESECYILVMPFYRKGSLSDCLKNKKIQTPTDILCFLYQITMAFLSFDKHAGCWHLDLKPDNILVKAEGEYLICDFGCAKLVDNLDNVSRMAISIGKGAGTTRYAAPQIILELVGGKFSDMWSLGIILFEILYDGDHPLINDGKHPLNPHPGVKPSDNYPMTVNKFVNGQVKIEYPPKPGFEKIIDLCKKMLEPKDRLHWTQLRTCIYNILGLPKRTNLVVNIDKFIKFSHNISRIAMGLVYYLDKNRPIFEKYGMIESVNSLIIITKAYTFYFFSEVKKTIEDPPKTKKGYMSTDPFYIFPEIRKHYRIQEKMTLTHLHMIIQNFCKKEASLKKLDLPNARLAFEAEISSFWKQLQAKIPNTKAFPPQSEFHKIELICKFVEDRSDGKMEGLDYEDREILGRLAHKVLYD